MLPKPILREIFVQLSPSDLCSVGIVCKEWATVSSEDTIWKFHYRERQSWSFFLKLNFFSSRKNNTQSLKQLYILWLRNEAKKWNKLKPDGKQSLPWIPSPSSTDPQEGSFLFRVLLLGNPKAGKGSILHR